MAIPHYSKAAAMAQNLYSGSHVFQSGEAQARYSIAIHEVADRGRYGIVLVGRVPPTFSIYVSMSH